MPAYVGCPDFCPGIFGENGINMKQLSILLGLVFFPFVVHSQNLEKVKTWFYENYRGIKTDQEISEFLSENREIKECLDNYY